jgi:hypothetical protein
MTIAVQNHTVEHFGFDWNNLPPPPGTESLPRALGATLYPIGGDTVQ